MCPHSLILRQTVLKMLNGLLFASLIVSARAQEASQSNFGQGFGPTYDAAHEITVVGTIQKVVTRHDVASPVGMHLLVSGSLGTVDAHLGPFVAQNVQEALGAGTEIRIVGLMETLHGRQFLLARQITLGGRTVILRTPRGVLVSTEPTRIAPRDSEETATARSNGGSR
jgi:hypothetical protein